ncbi:MAG: L-histidine N(alpha)-methyltransferase [Pseudomonadales bacterium]|nr:L-histidine N(alpha)-methyltransferase [Pseudomonadales bacterium]
MSEVALEVKQQGNVVYARHHSVAQNEKLALLAGLKRPQKTISPKYFYDTRGSELFEQITLEPEYYPTRTERSILNDNAEEIAGYCGVDSVLIEPGSGSSEKVRLILDELRPKAYVPMDIAGEFLHRSALSLSQEFPWLDIHAVCADFSSLNVPPKNIPTGNRVVFYPGSTLGNMTPNEAVQFLTKMRDWIALDSLSEQGGVLIGVDLHKSTERLNAAYNDKSGLTEQFNLNMLSNINNLFDGDFRENNFDHLAYYNEDHRRIEMHLVSKADHVVRLDDTHIEFSAGETIHTENSYKYTLASFAELASGSGLEVIKSWVDDENLFSVHYLVAK